MISYGQALEIAKKHVAQQEEESSVKLKVVEEDTIEGKFCWCFLYNSVKYLETGNFSDVVLGNNPLLISKVDGNLTLSGTAFPPQAYIDELDARLEKADSDQKNLSPPQKPPI